MGNEIRIKDLNGFLKVAAEQVNEGKDKKLTTEKEISAFMTAADKLVQAGLVQANYKETLGLTITQTSTEPVVEETKADKKAEKENLERVTKRIEQYISEEEYINTENLMENLEKVMISESLQPALEEVEKVIAFISNENVDSKKDIESLEDKINKEFKDLPNDLVKALVKLEKRTLIEKETNKLFEEYNELKKDNTNYTENLKAIKEKAKNCAYPDQTFQNVKAKVEEEIKTVAQTHTHTHNHTEKKDYEKDLKKEVFKKDNVAKKVVKELDEVTNVDVRRSKREARLEELKNVDEKELKKLNEKTLKVLEDSGYLENHKTDGTYDLTEISDVIRANIGADEQMDYYDDIPQSEAIKATEDLRKILNEDLTIEGMHDLRKFCDIEKTKKSRNLEDTTEDTPIAGLVGGTIGTALGHVKIKNVAEAVVKIDGEDIVMAKAEQLLEGHPVVGAVAGGVATIGLDVLFKTIFGVKKPESTCFDYTEAEGKSIEEYIDHLNTKEFPKNKEKADAIAILAKLYQNKYNEDWNKHFVADMKELAGNNVLNCLEFFSGKLGLTEKLQVEETEEQKEVEVVELDKEDATIPQTKEVDVLTFYGDGKSWQTIVDMYPCLGNFTDAELANYPTCKRRRNELPIRIMKIAQAITNDDYSKENLLFLAEESFKAKAGYNELKDIPGIDFEVLKSKLNASVLEDSIIKAPAELAGCKRTKKEAANAAKYTGVNNNITKALNAVGLTTKVDGEALNLYGLRKADGTIEVYTDMNKRDDAFKAEFNKAKEDGKNPKEVEKLTKQDVIDAYRKQ